LVKPRINDICIEIQALSFAFGHAFKLSKASEEPDSTPFSSSLSIPHTSLAKRSKIPLDQERNCQAKYAVKEFTTNKQEISDRDLLYSSVSTPIKSIKAPPSQSRKLGKAIHMYNHRPCPMQSHHNNYDLLSGSFKIPSTSSLLRASSKAQVCILV